MVLGTWTENELLISISKYPNINVWNKHRKIWFDKIWLQLNIFLDINVNSQVILID